MSLDTVGQLNTVGGVTPRGEAVAMPPRRSRFERVQLNTRVRVEVERMLQRFVDDHNTTVQSSVDLALAEFLAARGYPLPPADDRRVR